MEEERYPGEARVLRLFLAQLAPVAERELGAGSLLRHGIRRALATGRLAHLRHARSLFNALPRPEKQRLSDGLVRRSGAAAAARQATAPRPGAG